jgi:hypothetical protein
VRVGRAQARAVAGVRRGRARRQTTRPCRRYNRGIDGDEAGDRGEVGAAYDAQLDAGVDEQRETDGVLPATKEPLRPVDRVERPHP